VDCRFRGNDGVGGPGVSSQPKSATDRTDSESAVNWRFQIPNPIFVS
jgi:hypothetical protein